MEVDLRSDCEVFLGRVEPCLSHLFNMLRFLSHVMIRGMSVRPEILRQLATQHILVSIQYLNDYLANISLMGFWGFRFI